MELPGSRKSPVPMQKPSYVFYRDSFLTLVVRSNLASGVSWLYNLNSSSIEIMTFWSSDFNLIKSPMGVACVWCGSGENPGDFPHALRYVRLNADSCYGPPRFVKRLEISGGLSHFEHLERKCRFPGTGIIGYA